MENVEKICGKLRKLGKSGKLLPKSAAIVERMWKTCGKDVENLFGICEDFVNSGKFSLDRATGKWYDFSPAYGGR